MSVINITVIVMFLVSSLAYAQSLPPLNEQQRWQMLQGESLRNVQIPPSGSTIHPPSGQSTPQWQYNGNSRPHPAQDNPGADLPTREEMNPRTEIPVYQQVID